MARQRLRCSQLLVSLFVMALTAGGCGADEAGEAGDGCPEGYYRHALSGECEVQSGQSEDAGGTDRDSSFTDATSRNDVRPPDDSEPNDAGFDDTRSGDADDVDEDSGAGADVDEEPGPQDCPDRDGDGAADQACGGTDCDDNNASVAPGMAEVCDEHDNDCDGQLNQGLECSFYAHSPDDLYLVDPFARTATQVTSVPDLFDMDTHPDGTLYGITSSSLYQFDEAANDWTQVGSLGVSANANGLAIDNLGTAYMTGSSTAYTVDLATGAATAIGSMGTYNSSGDCVVNKDNSLFMSSNHNLMGGDVLVLIDGTTAQGQEVGATGERNIYGLTAAWGRMFGLTGGGKLIEIDSGTGQSTTLHTFSGITWHGAASTPQR